MTSVMTESLLSQSRLGLLNTRSEKVPMQSDGALSESERLGARLSSTQNITNVVGVMFQGELAHDQTRDGNSFRFGRVRFLFQSNAFNSCGKYFISRWIPCPLSPVLDKIPKFRIFSTLIMRLVRLSNAVFISQDR